MNYSIEYQRQKNRIGRLGFFVALSLINMFYLNLKIIWFGTTGETWFAIEPSTVLMPLITVYAIIHMIGHQRLVSCNLGVSTMLYLIYAAAVTLFNFNHSLYEYIFAFIEVVYWGCTMYLFYIYTLYKGFNNKIFKFVTVWFVSMCVIFLYRYSFYKTDGGFEGKTLLLNNVYYILFLLPFMLLLEKKSWQYLSFGLTFVAVVMSQKRGALIIIALCAVVWLLFSNKGGDISSKLKNLFLMLALGTAAYFILSYFMTSYDLSVTDRLMTLFNGEDTTGSGRNDIWERYFYVIGKDGIISLLGRGHDANVVSPKYNVLTWAHNDLIQITFNYGYFGAILFLIFVFNMFGRWKKMRAYRYKYTVVFFISLLITFINGLFSMCFVYPQWVLTSAALWGILIGDFNRRLE